MKKITLIALTALIVLPLVAKVNFLSRSGSTSKAEKKVGAPRGAQKIKERPLAERIKRTFYKPQEKRVPAPAPIPPLSSAGKAQKERIEKRAAAALEKSERKKSERKRIQEKLKKEIERVKKEYGIESKKASPPRGYAELPQLLGPEQAKKAPPMLVLPEVEIKKGYEAIPAVAKPVAKAKNAKPIKTKKSRLPAQAKAPAQRIPAPTPVYIPEEKPLRVTPRTERLPAQTPDDLRAIEKAMIQRGFILPQEEKAPAPAAPRKPEPKTTPTPEPETKELPEDIRAGITKRRAAIAGEN